MNKKPNKLLLYRVLAHHFKHKREGYYMGEKVTRFPISYSKRRKNLVGPLCVECQVSGRYLDFHPDSVIFHDGEFLTVDVMAMQVDEDKPSKCICKMIITKEDLLEAISHVKAKD